MKSLSDTPSFYSTEEEFMKYLGQTSYYITLQNCVRKIVSMFNPKEILELGFGVGTTSIILAKDNPNCKITSIDIRKDMRIIAENKANEENVNNIKFITADFTEHIKNTDKLPALVVLLYSFHHIHDPLEKKINFLNDCYQKLPKGGILCIAETFIPNLSLDPLNSAEIVKLWADRSITGYYSTFWASRGLCAKDSIPKNTPFNPTFLSFKNSSSFISFTLQSISKLMFKFLF